MAEKWSIEQGDCWCRVQLGALALGVLLPIALLKLHMYPVSNQLSIVHALASAIIAGAFIIIQCSKVFEYLMEKAKKWSRRRLLLFTIIVEICLSSINVLLSVLVYCPLPLWPISFTGWHFAVMVAATGSACGSWIGFCLWHYHHPQDKFQFSLRTLLVIMFVIGIVLAVFAPGS